MNSGIQFGAQRTKMTMTMNCISSKPGGAHHPDLNISIYNDSVGTNNIMSRQMQDVFKMLSGMFGDVRSMFADEQFDHFGSITDITPDAPQEGNIRDHYLKPGYNTPKRDIKEDVDLDGKISSEEIAGLLKRKDTNDVSKGFFDEGRRTANSGMFFQTIITKSITRPDGTVETRRIVKDHLGNVEETLTTTQRDGTSHDDTHTLSEPLIQDDFFKNFTSFWRIF